MLPKPTETALSAKPIAPQWVYLVDPDDPSPAEECAAGGPLPMHALPTLSVPC